jgi:predicted ester cyclase
VSKENKAVVRSFVEEAFNEGNLEAADEVYVPAFVSHESDGPVERSPEYVKGFVDTYRGPFPDGHTTAEDSIAEGDRVAYRWTFRGTHRGELIVIGQTERQVTITGLTVDRVSGGKIEVEWNNFDRLGMLQQLGAAPGR